MRIWPDVIKNIYWLISDGRLVNSWNDTWIRKIGPLKPFFEGIGQLDETLRKQELTESVGNGRLITPLRGKLKRIFLVLATLIHPLIGRCFGGRVVGVYWVALERGWIKLNTDSAISVSNGSTSIGGIFWDHYGKWISSFTMQTREEAMFKIEVKAILEGLKIVWDFDFNQLEVECDKALVVETILAGGAANSRMSELCLIHQLLEHDWRVCFRYLPRDLNKIADHMAKLPSLYCNKVQIYTEIPISIENLLKSDHLANITW
ncbi:hypothetical protein CXB51_022942 [Gossypium anomalum]|uniref:RNase H type-1 domain-containing protein n=1 Tax=Gossypium anomalum TaxID=47600 RepID=A0A8J5Y8H5_9ROSI|nr:hypothetical protein CXB51_022942 [Gossypium anomalum]